TSAASLPTASRTLAATSACSRGCWPFSVLNGTDSLIDSTTVGPATPNDLRVSSCAQTPPYWPIEPPITASGLPFRRPLPNGRESQSIAFLITAGMLPLYSGVTTSAASASAAADRSAATAAGTSASLSMSSL